ncbi:MAG: AzlC family ABC transporter permease [Microbacterium sp.]
MADERSVPSPPGRGNDASREGELLPGGVRAGIRRSVPACLAAIPLGLALGVLVVQSGLAWWWGTVFAAVVFAGSFEFLLLGLVTAAVPLSHIAASAFLVNARHIFYASTFPLQRIPGLGKAYATFALTDEAWALTATPESRRWRASRIIAIQAVFQFAWVASVTVGGLLGSLLPGRIEGLEFALPALFIVLAIDAYKARPDVAAPFVAVAAALTAGLLLGTEGLLVGGIVLYMAFVLIRFALRSRRNHA